MLTDIEIIDGYDNGSIKGITVCENYFFMPVRISGLGKTIRIDEEASKQKILSEFKDNPSIQIDENSTLENLIDVFSKTYVDRSVKELIQYKVIDRKMQHFANPKALQAMQGLPILKGHPQSSNGPSLLTFKNLKENPIIGAIVKAYIANKAVWGLTKIFDLKLLDEFQQYKSTSPAVESIEIEEHGGLTELPGTFNHLAFVEKGHWDQIDNLPYDDGIININIQENEGELKMVSEEKADEAVNQSTTEEIKQVEKEVEAIKSAEKEEAKNYDKMAESHKNLDGDENMEETSEETMVDEVSGDDLKSEAREGDEVASGQAVIVDEEEVEEPMEKFEDEYEVEISDDEAIDEDELESIEDEERDAIVDSMRLAVDSAHPYLKVKMPFVGKRYKPSVLISKILDANSNFLPPKYYSITADSAYGLLVDAYNALLEEIENESNRLYKETGRDKKNYWAPGKKSNEAFDRNF